MGFMVKRSYPLKKTAYQTSTLKIGEVAKAVRMPIVTVRSYELERLIIPVKGQAKNTGHRRFRPSVVGEIEFIKTCRVAGFSLAEIRSIMKLFRGFKPPAKLPMAAIYRTIDSIRHRTRSLEEIERILVLRMREPEANIEELIEGDAEILRLRGLGQKNGPPKMPFRHHRSQS
jgi:DNA-binding transcriptional MerR regulator